MSWFTYFELPLWAVLASGMAVVLIRIVAIQVSWVRLRRFGDPEVMGFRRRGWRESLLAILLGCGFAFSVAVFLPDAPPRTKSEGVLVLVFDAEGWIARQTPFGDRYAMAELMVGRVAELMGGNTSTPVAAIIHGAAADSRVPATRDLTGLLERIRTLLVVQTTAGLRAPDSSLAATMKRARAQGGSRNRVCIVTTRPPGEVSTELAGEAGQAEILIAGVPDQDGVSAYRSLVRNGTGFRQVGTADMVHLMSERFEAPTAGAYPSPRRPQVLAALALVALLCEWIFRTSGSAPQKIHAR